MPVAARSAAVGGFTIVEMMVVITVLALLMLIGLPSYTRWTANTQVRTAAESVQNGLRLAAAEAVKRNVQVDFVLTNDAVLSASPRADAAGGSWVVRVPGEVPQLVDQKPAAEATRNVQVASTAATVSFSGTGRLMPLPGGAALACMRFTHPTSDRPLLVTVTTGASVRMCDPAFGPADPRGCPNPAPC